MRMLTIEQACDYLEYATIGGTVDVGHALVHSGTSASGIKFVMVMDCFGKAVLSEAF